MTAPRVTVVVPTYNSAWCVGRTIASVLHQSLRDFELIVIDDGSTDDFAEAVAPYRDDDRVRIVHQSNSGLAATRNRGVAEARAPLIAPVDADDLWHPDFLEETVGALERDPQAPFAFAYSFRMDKDDYLTPYVIPKTPPRHDFMGLLSLNSVGCGSAAVYRRDLMFRCGGYDEDMGRRGLPGAEDWKLILRLARFGQPILIERHLVGYRYFEFGMSQYNPQRQFRAVLAVIDGIREEMPDVPPRALADARTMMTAWLLPAFAHRRKYGMFLAEGFRAYALNPFWFTNPLLRRAHCNRVKLVWRHFLGLFARRERARLHLSEAEFDGRRVFAYLPSPREPEPAQ